MFKALKNLVSAWANEPAEWYEFWMPQSGQVGGLIMGTILAILVINLVLA